MTAEPDQPTGPPAGEVVTADYSGPDRRRPHNRHQAARVLGALCVVALFTAIGGLFLELQNEKDTRAQADRESVVERKVTACVVRGVLELSRDRAARTGMLTEEDAALYTAALAPLRTDCPPLIVPPEVDRRPGDPASPKFPRTTPTP